MEQWTKSESGYCDKISPIHPHPAGQEVVHQALLLLEEFGEIVLKCEKFLR